MKYADQQDIQLGDIVQLAMPDGLYQARVVMLGENYQHLVLEQSFGKWVKTERILAEQSIIVEWIGENPFEHNDPQYAPVGNYMFTAISEDIKLKARDRSM